MSVQGQSRHFDSAPRTSALPRSADIADRVRQVRKVPILLKKSFWGDEQKFLEPLMRFTRSELRDHIVSSKIDHGSP
jgi:hypothetical protein